MTLEPIRRLAQLLTSRELAIGAAVNQPSRFFLLDAGRAVAAAAVLLWHYQHFFLPIGGRVTRGFAPFDQEPLQWLLAPFYRHGEIAVPIFWMISGFVFSRVYLAAEATTKEFVVHRFARLYPLHLLTLVVVTLLQILAIYRFGNTLIFGNNDVYHFVLQLLFASSWGFAVGHSFNAPIWSVSVEILIYAVFWLVHTKLGRLGIILPLLFAGTFMATFFIFGINPIAYCGYCFFLGSAVYMIYCGLASAPRLLAALALAAGSGSVALGSKISLPNSVLVPVAAGSAIILLVVCEGLVRPGARRTLAMIGDNTYGMYLWHIPIQLSLILIFDTSIAATAESPLFLGLFILLVIAVSKIGYVLFERPARDRLRSLT